jgi:hypothetical protein
VLEDPLLVIASTGDGVINMLPRESGRFGPSPGILAAVDGLPVEVSRHTALTAAPLRGPQPPKTAFLRLEEANHIRSERKQCLIQIHDTNQTHCMYEYEDYRSTSQVQIQ